MVRHKTTALTINKAYCRKAISVITLNSVNISTTSVATKTEFDTAEDDT